MAQEEGEGIPLKMANEYRRTNRMGPLTSEQFEARKAVIRANNQKAEEAVMGKRVQTLSRIHNQTPRTLQTSRVHRAPRALQIRNCHKEQTVFQMKKQKRSKLKGRTLKVQKASNASPLWNTTRKRRRSKAVKQRSKTRQVQIITFQLTHTFLQVRTKV